MAYLPGGSFNAADVDPSSPREILPKGEYRVHIVKSDLAQTQKGGTMLVLEFDVLDGEHQGRKVWDRINLVNANETAQRIGQQTLSAICRATGVMNLTDSEHLHFKPLVALVAVEFDSRDVGLPEADRRMQNTVKGYKHADGSAIKADGAPASTAQAAPVAQAATPAAGGKTPSWKRPPGGAAA